MFAFGIGVGIWFCICCNAFRPSAGSAMTDRATRRRPPAHRLTKYVRALCTILGQQRQTRPWCAEAPGRPLMTYLNRSASRRQKDVASTMRALWGVQLHRNPELSMSSRMSLLSKITTPLLVGPVRLSIQRTTAATRSLGSRSTRQSSRKAQSGLADRGRQRLILPGHDDEYVESRHGPSGDDTKAIMAARPPATTILRMLLLHWSLPA